MNFCGAYCVTYVSGFASDVPSDVGAEPGMAARFAWAWRKVGFCLALGGCSDIMTEGQPQGSGKTEV